MFVRSAILACLVGSSMATVYPTSPTESTVCAGGSPCTITWIDDGKSPALADFGDARVGVFVGSVNSQSMLQEVVANVSVVTTSTISFTVDPNMGENSSEYFVRFDSTTGNQAFSSKFTLNSMTGTFNSTILAQIAAADESASASSSVTSTSSSAKTSTTSKASSTSSSSASSSSASSGAGRNVVVSGVVGAVGVVAALSSYLF